MDLNYAYSQLPLSKETSKHCNFSILGGKATGTYRFKTGFYGLTDMPTEFQKAMDRTLGVSNNEFCFLDDVLIATVGTIQEHNEVAEATLIKLFNEGFSLKLSKCEFSVVETEWLGFKLNREGVTPVRSKVEDILNLKPPKTLGKLRSFVGSINHLQRFLPGCQTQVAEFKESMSKGNKLKFTWSAKQDAAFFKLLELVAAITKNYHYSAKRKTRLKCDASKQGLGACLEQEIEPGVWVPISFASRQLNSQEAKYSTSELELLAVVWSTYHFR